jgi:hypothetical protein
MQTLALIAIALSLFSIPAVADDTPLKVQDLYSACKGKDMVGESLCVGFVAGVGDAMHFLSAHIPDDPQLRTFAICGTMSHREMVHAFVNWAENHQDKWTEIEVTGVMSSLIETWPCSASKK